MKRCNGLRSPCLEHDMLGAHAYDDCHLVVIGRLLRSAPSLAERCASHLVNVGVGAVGGTCLHPTATAPPPPGPHHDGVSPTAPPTRGPTGRRAPLCVRGRLGSRSLLSPLVRVSSLRPRVRDSSEPADERSENMTPTIDSGGGGSICPGASPPPSPPESSSGAMRVIHEAEVAICAGEPRPARTSP